MTTTQRSSWKGSITFGLVSLPVGLYPTTSDTDKTSFHQHRASDGSRIRLKKVAEADGAEVPASEIVKGIEIGGKIVTLTTDDMAALPVPSVKEIAVELVVDEGSIDPLLFSGKSYYAAPEKAGVRAYALLRDALADAGLAAVVKVTLRQRESVGLLVARPGPGGGVLVLELLHWAADIRQPAFPLLDSPPVMLQAERDMAAQLIGAMKGTFDPSAYTDEYAIALDALVEAKAAGTDLPAAAAPADTTPASLMDALSASLAATK